MDLRVGLCGFTIGSSSYYERFSVVEVQQTFYDPPARHVLERWRGQAPPAFEFTMKAWQVITHRSTSRTYRRLKSPFTESDREAAGSFRWNPTVRAAWEKSLECAVLLHATAILFQCPASFRATEANLDAMRTFFGRIERPSGVMLLWEPRGAWPDETVASVCRQLGLIHAVDPFVRPSLTPEVAYWRLHGNGSHYASYSDEELHELRQRIPTSTAGVTYAMFNNIPRVRDEERFGRLAT